MPGSLMSPSLAESWTVSADQKTYEFKLRKGLKFHNGDPLPPKHEVQLSPCERLEDAHGGQSVTLVGAPRGGALKKP